MDGVAATPNPSTSPVRWGISDAAIAWVVALVVGVLASGPFVERNDIPKRDEAIATFVIVVFQSLAGLVVLGLVAHFKGRGSLSKDFGVRGRLRDAPWLIAGLLLGGVSSLFTAPILDAGDITEQSQAVRRILDEADGLELALLAVAFVVIGPLAEEVLFRGALLRGLQRRVSTSWAVFASALVFALVHPLLDIGTGFAVPALLFLGLVSGWRAAQTGSLSQSIYLHAGFNLLTVLGRLIDT